MYYFVKVFDVLEQFCGMNQVLVSVVNDTVLDGIHVESHAFLQLVHDIAHSLHVLFPEAHRILHDSLILRHLCFLFPLQLLFDTDQLLLKSLRDLILASSRLSLWVFIAPTHQFSYDTICLFAFKLSFYLFLAATDQTMA